MTVTILTGDCREVLATLPDQSVHCCVTSPPYFGLRDYGIASQIGLEPTPDAYVAELVAVFREVRRVLKDTGTLWLNLGDSYSTQAAGKVANPMAKSTLASVKTQEVANESSRAQGQYRKGTSLPEKNLIGIPWRVAFALQADGWYLRQDIIWSKPNPMPESVRDRCTKAHEYIFMLSKQARYYYDADAISEPGVYDGPPKPGKQAQTAYTGLAVHSGNLGRPAPKVDKQRGHGRRHDGFNDRWDKMERDEQCNGMRNKRSVWTVATQPFPGSHFGVFPPALIDPCIKAGCPEKCCAKCGAPWVRDVERTSMVIDRSERTHDKGRTRASGTMLEPAKSVTLGFSPSCDCVWEYTTKPGVVLDPFFGAGTTGLVADRLQRNCIGIELNPAYVAMARARCDGDAPLLAVPA